MMEATLIVACRMPFSPSPAFLRSSLVGSLSVATECGRCTGVTFGRFFLHLWRLHGCLLFPDILVQDEQGQHGDRRPIIGRHSGLGGGLFTEEGEQKLFVWLMGGVVWQERPLVHGTFFFCLLDRGKLTTLLNFVLPLLCCFLFC